MIILVPAEEPNSFMGYGRHNHGIVDDMVDDRRRYETATPRSTSRSTSVTSLRIKQSLEADFDGGFGLKRRGGVMTILSCTLSISEVHRVHRAR
jgi:hypothetical protein